LLASGDDLHNFTVTAVRPGSGAERDGFKKGDVVKNLDGKPSSGFLLSELRDTLTRAGEHHQIEVQRDKDVIHLPIEVTLVSLDAR
jgi:S1-C subfamily serine protease